MLKLEALKAWMQNTGTITKPYACNRTPATIDEIVTLTDRPGMPTEVDDAFDNPGVGVKARSPRDDPQAARDLIHHIDAFFLDASRWPFLLDGRLVIAVRRAGSGPSYMGVDDQQRTTYLCNYVFTIQRSS